MQNMLKQNVYCKGMIMQIQTVIRRLRERKVILQHRVSFWRGQKARAITNGCGSRDI